MRGTTKQLEPILVNENEAADLIRIDLPTLQKLVATGQLPIRMVDGQRLIPYKALLLFAGVARWKYQEID